MKRFCPFSLTILLSFTMLLLIVIPASANFPVVYEYNDIFNSWVALPPSENANACCWLGIPAEYSGNMVVSSVPLQAKATINFAGKINYFTESSLPSGRFAVNVEAVTANIEKIYGDGEYFFVLPAGEYGRWRFFYRVENTHNHDVMVEIIVNDSFRGDIKICKDASGNYIYSTAGSSGIALNPRGGVGKVSIRNHGEKKDGSFIWHDFILLPGQWAELVMEVETGNGQWGGDGYISWERDYLNSQGTFNYRRLGSGGQKSMAGHSFILEVPFPNSVELTLSTSEVKWYLRKPGDYHARILQGTIAGHHPVAVSFADFHDITGSSYAETIAVYYALAEKPGPSDWLTPAELNSTVIVLELDENTNNLTWNMWQRVVLHTQRVGTYVNKGVIRLTLVNTEDSFN